MQKYFTGRFRERRMLTDWLTIGPESVLTIIALGGMGKSALNWAWLQRDVLGLPLPGLPHDPPEVAEACRVPEVARPEGVLWWSFYEREARFVAFVEEALAYVSSGSVDPGDIPLTYEKVRALVALLQRRRFLLILDGFERELRAYASLAAAYQGDVVAEDERGDFRACTDPHAATFLRWVAASPLQSRVLLTSRLFPRELDGLVGCQRVELTALNPEDAVAFFHVQGVRGTRAEIQSACAPYGYHPLALRLLAGMIVRDPSHPGDVTAATRYSPIPKLVPREHHILALAYDALRPPLQELLSRLAAFRSPVEYEVAAVLSPFESKRELGAAFRELVDRGLLFFDRERGRYDLHPVVRRYAYDRLADKEGTHTRLRDYFAAVPEPEQVESLDDLAPTIELYHHTVRAGRYDEAIRLFRDRLHNPLYYRFGAYQLIIELLHALFPGGEPFTPSGEAALPQLSEESDQAWTLNGLGSSYARVGQPGSAVRLAEKHNVLREKADDKENLAIGLGNLAARQLPIGALAAAEENLRHEVEFGRSSDEYYPGWLGTSELGRLLVLQGGFDEASDILDEADKYAQRAHMDQWKCVDTAHRALRSLLMGDAGAVLEAARQARELADVERVERDIIRAEWLLGAAHRARGELAQAEPHLAEALRRCRRINMVDHEPDILLELARLRHAQAQEKKVRRTSEVRRTWEAEALSLAQEALDIADRCQYRLVQADCHNFLAQLALEAGDRQKARQHAETARERAWCDGPPHRYEAAFQEAERLLERIASDAERARRS